MNRIERLISIKERIKDRNVFSAFYNDELILFNELIDKDLKGQKTILELRELVWGKDIPSPCCPEYVEHHRDIQEILKFIDERML